MKKLLFIMLLLPLTVLGQVGRLPYQTLRQSYRGDTLDVKLGTTNVEYKTSLSGFSFDNPLIIRDTTLNDLIKKHSSVALDSSKLITKYGLTNLTNNIQITSNSGSCYQYAIDTTLGFQAQTYPKVSSVYIHPYSVELHSQTGSGGSIAATYHTTPYGFYADADYSAANASKPRWIPDKAYVDAHCSTRLASFYTNVATSGTGETTLYSYTLPANTLASNGDVIECEYYGISSASTGGVKIYFGSAHIDMSLGVAGYFTIKVVLVRSSSTTIRGWLLVSMEHDSWNTISSTTTSDLTTIDFTASNNIILKATADNSVITAETGTIVKL